MKARVLIVALLASGLSVGAGAQGTRVGALAPGERIDDARARLRDESLSGAERLDALRDLMAALDARGAMTDVPAETRARDAVELAESALTASAWEGVQATASVGVLTPSMREAARAHATRALDALAVYARHANGERTNDDALALRATLARARAGALLRAATSDERARATGLEALRAVRSTPTLLRAAESVATGGAAAENAEAEAQRLVLLGLLAMEEGQAGEARARFEAAAQIGLSARTRAEAALGASLATRAVEGPGAATDRLHALERDGAFAEIERDDPLVRLLRADALRRVALARAEFATGDDLAGAARDAAAPYFALAERGAPGIDPISLRALLLEKAAASGAPLLARVGDGRAGAFERTAAAVAKGDAQALERLIIDESTLDALGPFGADALWALLRAAQDNQARSASVRHAARAGLALGERFPDDPRAGAALGLAASGAQRLASAESEPESLALYERVLRAALAHAGRASDGALRVDSLRFELGRVLAVGGRDAEATERLREVVDGELGVRAADLLLSIAQRSGDERAVVDAAALVERRARAILAGGENPDARRALERAGAVGQTAELRAAIARGDAQAARVAASAMASSGAQGAEGALRREAIEIVEALAAAERTRGELTDAQRATARVAVEIAAALVETSERAKSAALEGDRVVLARAQRMTGDPTLAREAADALERVTARVGRTPDLLGELAEALRGAGDDERSFGVYRELANATRPDDPRTRSLHWLAWGRMLTILAANNADGARTTMIRAQAERLRLIDPELGGSPHRERIEAAERAAR